MLGKRIDEILFLKKKRKQDSGLNDQVYLLQVKFTQLNKAHTTPKYKQYKVNNEQRLLQGEITWDVKKLMKQSKLHCGPELASFKHYVVRYCKKSP